MAVQQATKKLQDRLFRELRYLPEFEGTVSVTIFVKRGSPRSIRDEATNNDIVQLD